MNWLQKTFDIRIFHIPVFKRLTVIMALALAVASQLAFGQETVRPYLSFEQRLFLSYLVLGAQESSEVQDQVEDRIKKMLERLQKNGVEEVKVQNFDEFMLVWRGQWPGAHKLNIDIELIEAREDMKVRTISSDDPEVQRQIDAYMEDQKDFIRRSFQGINSEMAFAENREELKKRGEQVFADQIAQFDSLGEKIGSTQLKNMNGGMKRVLELVVGDYFLHLSLASKKQIFNIAMGLPLDASEMEKFEAMVSGGGPQFQKLLQILAREKNISPELLDVFRKLESTVRPAPWVIVEKMLEAEAKNYKFIEVEKSPLGVGTMAQVHRGKMIWSEATRDVVIRFIKPDMMERVEEDRRILSELAPKVDTDPLLKMERFPPLTPIVNDITESVIEEFNFKETMQRQFLARERYITENKRLFKKYGRVLLSYVPQVFKPKKSDSKLMVQELVTGKKLDKAAAAVAEELPDLKRIIVEELARKWIKEAIFGEGFFHADLHQGNFMVDVGPIKIQLNILDYGMAGVLTREVRDGVLQLGVGIRTMDARVISAAFWKLSDKNQNKISKANLDLRMKEEVRAIKKGTSQSRSFEQWTAFAIEQGVVFPSHFVNLNRGFVILNKLLSEVGSEWDMSAIARNSASGHPFRVIKTLFAAEGFSLYDFVRLGLMFIQDEIQVSTLKFKARLAKIRPVRCERLLLRPL